MPTIRIHLIPEDLTRMRFAYSPLIELVASYRMLHSGKPNPLYQRWMEEAGRALDGLEFPYLHTLAVGRSYIPDFITPTPTLTGLTLEDEIEQLLSVPDSVIRKNVQLLISADGDSELRQHFLMYPHEVLLCLVDELHLYWQRTLAAHWQRMTAILEGDVLYRARQLAVEGAPHLLGALHPNLQFHSPMTDNTLATLHVTCSDSTHKPPHTPYLQFGKDNTPTCTDVEAHLDGAGLQLVPVLFSANKLLWQVVPEWRPMLIYGVRGLGLWQQSLPESNTSLEAALGAARARVLQALIPPANTGEVARKLALSAGAVSQHLNRLNEAGLVEPHRSGKRVFYQLTRRGQALIDLFERMA